MSAVYEVATIRFSDHGFSSGERKVRGLYRRKKDARRHAEYLSRLSESAVVLRESRWDKVEVVERSVFNEPPPWVAEPMWMVTLRTMDGAVLEMQIDYDGQVGVPQPMVRIEKCWSHERPDDSDIGVKWESVQEYYGPVWAGQRRDGKVEWVRKVDVFITIVPVSEQNGFFDEVLGGHKTGLDDHAAIELARSQLRKVLRDTQ